MKKFITKYKLEIIGTVAGAVIGWFYWYFIGCASGSCAITSSPVNSSIYGAFMGGTLLSMFRKKSETPNEKKNEEPG